jgi:uncharacterized protein (TIGR03437 family)
MRSIVLALILFLAATAAFGENQQYIISTVAGGGALPTPVPAVDASIDHADGLAVDDAGNTYMAALNCIFKISPNGEMIRIAGTGRPGFSGDGGPAVNAKLDTPTGLARDAAGNLLLVDGGNHRIRKIAIDGSITTVAGNGSSTYSGDGEPALRMGLVYPTNIALDGAGNLYIMDSVRVLRVDGSGTITTVAGDGTWGTSGDGGAATKAKIGPALAIAADSSGNIYVSQSWVIRRIDSKGVITRFAGGLTSGDSGDGGPASAATFGQVDAMVIDSKGNLYLYDEYTRRIRKVTPDGTIRAFAGNGSRGFSGDGGTATAASIGSGTAITVDSVGAVTFGDNDNSRVRKVTTDGIIHTIAGNGVERFSGDGGPATSALLSYPQGVAVDSSGTVYFTDTGNNRVRRVTPAGVITTIAGTGSSGFSGDGGPATAAEIGTPIGIAVDAGGNVYVACLGDVQRIRKISPAGIISTVAGGGKLASDGVAATAAIIYLSLPAGIAVDRSGNIYFTDPLAGVRKISADGMITTVKASGIPGVLPRFDPHGIAVDASGNLYVADMQNNRIYKIAADGSTATIAGIPGVTGASGDGGLASKASVFGPTGVAVDHSGNLYIVDTFAAKIRRISTDGIITTIAGAGKNSDDGVLSVPSRLVQPWAVAVDARGAVYIADENNIRRLDPIAPRYVLQAVTNGASNAQGPIAPGEIIVLWGAGIGPQNIEQAQNTGQTIYTLRSGTVHVNGVPAPTIYAQDNQVAAVVPNGLRSGDAARITVTYLGPTTAEFVLPIAPAGPAIFTLDSTGTGPAAALNQDNSVNSAAVPASAGDVITLFATGEGETTPASTDGRVAAAPLPKPVLPVSVTIGGKPAQVQYGGSAPGTVGLLQVNAVVPSGLAPGVNEVILQVGSYRSQAGVTIAVH